MTDLLSHPLDRSVFIDEAAQALGVSRRTIYYRIRQGRLRTVRTRNGSQRVLWSSIEALRCEDDSLTPKRRLSVVPSPPRVFPSPSSI